MLKNKKIPLLFGLFPSADSFNTDFSGYLRAYGVFVIDQSPRSSIHQYLSLHTTQVERATRSSEVQGTEVNSSDASAFVSPRTSTRCIENVDLSCTKCWFVSCLWRSGCCQALCPARYLGQYSPQKLKEKDCADPTTLQNEHRMGRRLLSPIDKHILFLSVPQTMSRWPASAPVLQDPVA